MFLKTRENRPLGKLLFREKLPAIRELLHDYLTRLLRRLDTWTYEVKPENFEKLNFLLFELKESLKENLRWAPLPFFFILTKERDLSLRPKFLRPGKIYAEKRLLGDVEKVLSKGSFSFRIEKVDENFAEIVFPSTTDHTLMFFFKDIFYTPEDRPCFFCGTHLHKTEACPALRGKLSLEDFINLLKLSPRTIGEELWRSLRNHDESNSAYRGFFGRHYYLLPSFLRVPVYFPVEIQYWTELQKPLNYPVRGGSIYLALDALIRQDYATAERGFIEQEGDLRAELGLTLLNCLREDFARALYHLENALVSAKSPFLRSYLLFLKGYIHYYQNDYYTAEELLKEALRVDSGCIPAFYFLQILRHLEGENWSKIFPFFQNPQTIYLAVLEPTFIGDEKELEDTIERTISSFREEAVRRLKEAEDKFHKMQEFFEKDDKEEYAKVLDSLRSSIYGGGLLLIEEAGKRALELNLELNQFVFSKIKKVREELKNKREKAKEFEKFWQSYPYKEEDKIFEQKLDIIQKLTGNIEKRLRTKEPTKELKNIYRELSGLTKHLKELSELRPQLERKWRFRLRLYLFLKRFLLAEGVLFVIFLTPILFSESIPSDFFTITNFLLLSLAILLIVLISSVFTDK